eukprot:3165639-Pyramimonas_sp.AAC.1
MGENTLEAHACHQPVAGGSLLDLSWIPLAPVGWHKDNNRATIKAHTESQRTGLLSFSWVLGILMICPYRSKSTDRSYSNAISF